MSDRITVTLPDGSQRDYPSGSTPVDVAASIGKRLAKDALAAKADGEWIDTTTPLVRDAKLEIVTPASDDDLARVESRMREIVAANQPFRREELPFHQALQVFADQPYKREIIERVR